MTSKLLAFLWADIQVARSYRLRYIMQFVTFGIPLIGLFFMSRVFNQQEVTAVNEYGGNYLTFVIVGMSVTLFSTVALRSVTRNLARFQRSGTLEVLLLTRASLPTIMLGSSIYSFLRSLLGLATYIVGGLMMVGLSIQQADAIPAIATVLLIMIVMGSIGLISAAFQLVFKQGDPVTGLFLLGGALLAGTVYPIDVFPSWLQSIAVLFPQMHALEAARLSILRGFSLGALSDHIGVLLVYAAILLPVSLLIFQAALRRAKTDGTLAHY